MIEIEKNIIIVGAGFAGLAAGRKLMEQNIQDFLILEARDVIGGRVQTYSTKNGYKVDLGASWIGLIPKLNLRDLINYGWQQFQLDRLAKTVNLKDPSKTKNANYLDSITLHLYLKQWFRKIPCELISRAFENVFGVKPDRLSLLYALQYIKSCNGCDDLFESRNGAQRYKIVGGSSVFTKKLAENLQDKILTNEAVLEIEDNINQNFVKIKTQNKTYKCQKVIITAPARVLKNIKFTFSLPLNKNFLIQNQITYGSMYKCSIIYDKPFWRQNNLTGFIFNPKGVIISTFDGETDENSSYYKLVGFLDFDAIEQIGADKHDKITQQIMKELEQFFGLDVHNYKEIVYSDILSSNKFIGGCPIGVLTYGIGVLTKYADRLDRPTGRLFWSGTETSDIGQGYLEGAIRSGERSVNQVLNLKEKEDQPNLKNRILIISILIIILAYIFL